MVIIGDDSGDDEIGDAERCVVIIILMTVGDAEDARVVIMTVGDAEDAR